MNYVRARGQDYLDFLGEMHDRLLPKWYLEIGTRWGESLCKSRTHSIAIDPAFALRHDVLQNKPSLQMFQQTSDDFYATGFMEASGTNIDLAFLDGMHLFEYLLRDFINTERHCTTDGRIVLHDCVPWNRIMTERDWDNTKTKVWTGDVWKLMPILRKYRPDLTLDVYDCAPTGLVVVSGLDAKNDVLSDKYDQIVADWMDTSIEDEMVGNYFEALNLKSATTAPWKAGKATAKTDQPISFSIVVGAWGPRRMLSYGDYPFARSLGDALERRGHHVRIDARKTHQDDRPDVDVDLFLKGINDFSPRDDKVNLMWLLYGTDELNQKELAGMDHIFVASTPFTKHLQNQYGIDRVSTLLQAFDAQTMYPCSTSPRGSFLFVGFNKRSERQSVEWAMDEKLPLEIYGPRWDENKRAMSHIRGDRVENSELRYHYSNAVAVLNDHRADMLRDGFVSNRIFDVLACGAPVITDDVAGLPSELAPWVYSYTDKESYRAAATKALSESSDRKKERIEFANTTMRSHSFDARAIEIEKQAISFLSKS